MHQELSLFPCNEPTMVAQKFMQVISLDEQMYTPIPKRFPEKEDRYKQSPSAIHKI